MASYKLESGDPCRVFFCRVLNISMSNITAVEFVTCGWIIFVKEAHRNALLSQLKSEPHFVFLTLDLNPKTAQIHRKFVANLSQLIKDA